MSWSVKYASKSKEFNHTSARNQVPGNICCSGGGFAHYLPEKAA
jgi:hypothetical protein